MSTGELSSLLSLPSSETQKKYNTSLQTICDTRMNWTEQNLKSIRSCVLHKYKSSGI